MGTVYRIKDVYIKDNARKHEFIFTGELIGTDKEDIKEKIASGAVTLKQGISLENIDRLFDDLVKVFIVPVIFNHSMLSDSKVTYFLNTSIYFAYNIQGNLEQRIVVPYNFEKPRGMTVYTEMLYGFWENKLDSSSILLLDYMNA